MDRPKLEIIVDEILNRLNTVKVTNNYPFDLNIVRLKTNTHIEHLKGVLYQDLFDYLDGTLNETIVTVNFGVAVWIIDPETTEANEIPIDETQNKILSSLHIALFNSGGTFDGQLGGLVDRVEVLAPDPFQLLKDGTEGVTFNFSITYRHSIEDPTK